MELGKNLIVSVMSSDGGFDPIAAAKSCSIKLAQEFIKVASPISGRTFQLVPTTYDWQLQVDCLIPNVQSGISLSNELIYGREIFVRFQSADMSRGGYAYIKSCDESGSVGNLAKFSATINGSGPLYYIERVQAPQTFTEGNGIEMNVNPENGAIYLEPNQLYSMLIRGISIPSGGGKVYIGQITTAWVLVRGSVASTKAFVAQMDSQTLELNEVAFGTDDVKRTIDLPEGEYTFLTKEEEGFEVFELLI